MADSLSEGPRTAGSVALGGRGVFLSDENVLTIDCGDGSEHSKTHLLHLAWVNCAVWDIYMHAT